MYMKIAYVRRDYLSPPAKAESLADMVDLLLLRICYCLN